MFVDIANIYKQYTLIIERAIFVHYGLYLRDLLSKSIKIKQIQTIYIVPFLSLNFFILQMYLCIDVLGRRTKFVYLFIILLCVERFEHWIIVSQVLRLLIIFESYSLPK